MKTPILSSFVLLCLCAGVTNVFAGCTPVAHAYNGQVSSPQWGRCPSETTQTANVTVYEQYGIRWSDNVYTFTGPQDIRGFGMCHSRWAWCAPDFYDLRYHDDGSLGRFTKMARSRKFVGYDCVVDFEVPKGVTHHCDTVSQICPNIGAAAQCLQNNGEWDYETCTCTGGGCTDCSPIIVDPSGNGFDLTSAENGVSFDITADGITEQIGWTSGNSDEAFLVLDRDNDGRVDDGSELFGNFTPQPVPPAGQERNGFLALAEFDRPGNGGNGDGWIGPADSVFSWLRLWQDINHNGVSESNELKTLTAHGLRRIDIDYQRSQRIDEFGNEFRYRSKVKDAQGQQFGRWAWDVFFVSQP